MSAPQRRGRGRLKRRGGNRESQAEVGEGEEVKKLCRARQEEGSTTRQIGMGGHTSKHGTPDAGTVQCTAVLEILDPRTPRPMLDLIMGKRNPLRCAG